MLFHPLPLDDDPHSVRSRWQKCEGEVEKQAFLGFATGASIAGLFMFIAGRMNPGGALARMPPQVKCVPSILLGMAMFDRWSQITELNCAYKFSIAHLNAKRAAEGKPPLKHNPNSNRIDDRF
eukprot:tig00020904_g15157.t1